MEQTVINAEVRGKTGKGESKRLRREGKIPGVLYGKGTAMPLALSVRQLQQVAAGEGAKLLQLEIPGQPRRTVVLKAAQYDFLYKNLSHVDLQEVSLTQKLTVSVPVVLTGEESRGNDGGIVQQQLHEVEIECLPTNLPEQISCDVSNLAIGQALTVGQLTVGEGIQIKTPLEEVVANIVAPNKANSEANVPAEESEEETAKENA